MRWSNILPANHLYLHDVLRALSWSVFANTQRYTTVEISLQNRYKMIKTQRATNSTQPP